MESRSNSLLAAAILVGATCGGLCASPARANLVANGSFEDPIVSAPTQFTSIPGWTATKGIEIQNSRPGFTPQQGNQFIELDPFENTSISQALAVIPGLPSELKFYYSPRPGYPASTNGLEVKLDGSTIFSLAADGTGLTDTSWTLYSHAYTPATSSATIVFTGTGTSDTIGAFVDNVSYSQVPGPLPVMGAGVAFRLSRKLRRRITSAGLG